MPTTQAQHKKKAIKKQSHIVANEGETIDTHISDESLSTDNQAEAPAAPCAGVTVNPEGPLFPQGDKWNLQPQVATSV